MKKSRSKRMRLALRTHTVLDLTSLPTTEHLMPQKQPNDWWWENVEYIVYLYDSP